MPTSFVPMKRMFDRANDYGDSDPLLFMELLYTGEFLMKLTVLAAIATLDEDHDDTRYRYLHSLVRTSKLGLWADTLAKLTSDFAGDEVPGSHPLRAFAEVHRKGSWQLDAIAKLHNVRTTISRSQTSPRSRAQLHHWFAEFTALRNGTRGHGAITPAAAAQTVPDLLESISAICDQHPLFSLPWAYLHRNLSGKYRVLPLSHDAGKFSPLKSAPPSTSPNLSNGIYIWMEGPRQVPLLYGDINGRDFFVPNGDFRKDTFEVHSSITDDRKRHDATRFMMPPGRRPPSETEGLASLEIVGDTFTNIPSRPEGYIRRESLEKEVLDLLVDDRHPIITLVGRGGIGKTSLALEVLHEVCMRQTFDMIVWFSARDIDLTAMGPKPVRSRTRTAKDIAEEYTRLIVDLEVNASSDIIEQHMGVDGDVHATSAMRRLFVFDNFETVAHPTDLYSWIDTHIRLPNKALITSRFRDFKADFPIVVSGMDDDQAHELVADTCRRFDVSPPLSPKVVDNIVDDSEGHPYVIKIMVGEYADDRNAGRPSKVIARKDDILAALFERTYENLTPLALKLFLTLSAWRSLLPQIIIEAILHWRSTEGVDPQGAVDELARMSLVEVLRADDGTDFLRVPVTAAIFGKGKLEVNEQHELVMADVKLLQRMGPTTQANFRRGSGRSIDALFRVIATELQARSLSFGSVRPMLEFVAFNHPPAWLLLAQLERESGGLPANEVRYLRRFLEGQPGDRAGDVWRRLVDVCRESDDVVGSCSAFLNVANVEGPRLEEISNMANYVNSSDAIRDMDPNQRAGLLRPLAGMFGKYMHMASAVDLSRLAWLHLHIGDFESARKIALLGIERQPENLHCRRLIARL